MTSNEPSPGVSNCFVFKSRLQEYAQKLKLPTPVYDTIKEGPPHKSTFHSTVILDGVSYDSLPGFFNRKAAEQSAAEVALQELAKSSEQGMCASQPVHEMGLCKNLLQEYAQKMNYAIPMYQCSTKEAVGRTHQYTCTVEIGGIKYIGAASRTKRDAEISAGRTALIAIQSDSNMNLFNCNTQLTVVPCEKKTAEVSHPVEKTIKAPKARRAQFKRKAKAKRKLATTGCEGIINPPPPTEHCQNDQPPTDHCQINQPPTEHSQIDQPPSEHCQIDQPSTEHCQIDQPPTEHCQIDQPPTEHCQIDQPPTEHCQIDQPPTEHCQIDQPPTEHCQIDQPPAEHFQNNQSEMDTETTPKLEPQSPTKHFENDQSEKSTETIPKLEPQPSTEHLQNDQSEKSTEAIPKLEPQPPTEQFLNNQSEKNTETTPKLEPSSCVDGFKEAAIGSVEREEGEI